MDFDGDCISFVVMPSAAAFKYIAPSPGVEIADSGDAFSSGGCTVLHRWALASPNCWKIQGDRQQKTARRRRKETHLRPRAENVWDINVVFQNV